MATAATSGAAVLQRCPRHQRPSQSARRRQRLPHAPRLHGDGGGVAGRRPARRRTARRGPSRGHRSRQAPHGARALGIRQRPEGNVSFPLSGHAARAAPALSLDTREAELRRRRYPWSQTEAVAADAWQFARVEGGGRIGQGDLAGSERAIVPSDTPCLPAVRLRDGLDLRTRLHGARSAGPRSRASPACATSSHSCGTTEAKPTRWLGRGTRRRASSPGVGPNRAAPFAISSTAGSTRTRTAARSSTASSPMWPGEAALDNRFSNLVVAASRQYEDWLNPADRFPFSYAPCTDHVTGETDAILKRPATDPLVIHSQTASEYWHRRGSLVHTDTHGNDLPQPDTVRVYLWSSSQHWSDPFPFRLEKGVCQNFQTWRRHRRCSALRWN